MNALRICFRMMLGSAVVFFVSLVVHTIEGSDGRFSAIMMLLFTILGLLCRIIEMLERRAK